MTDVITLSKTHWQTFLRFRRHRYSDAVLRYDPEHPVLSIQQEKDFWKNEVTSGHHLIWDIRYNKTITIGFIHAFNFALHTCETGISILFHKYRNRGYGYSAYNLLLELLKQKGISSTYIWTTVQNAPAIALYEKLGYIFDEKSTDTGTTWVKYVLHMA